MHKKLPVHLLVLLVVFGLLLSACNPGGGPTPEETEIVIDSPVEAAPTTASTPVPTPTLREVQPTETMGEAAATPTATLDPYSTLIQEGIRLRTEAKFDESVAKLNEAIQMDQGNTRGYIERGITYLVSDRLDEAITDLNYALNYEPNSPEIYSIRGNIWAQRQQYDLAEKDYNQAMTLDPNYAKAYTNRAITYMLQQKFDLALADFTKAVELSPDDPETYFNRGQAYITASGMTAAADPAYLDLCIADFNQVLEFREFDAEAYYSRGLCQSLKGNIVYSMQDYTRAIEIDPNQPKFYLYRALLYPDLGTLEQATSDLNKVLELATEPDLRSVAEEMLPAIPQTPTPTLGPTITPFP